MRCEKQTKEGRSRRASIIQNDHTGTNFIRVGIKMYYEGERESMEVETFPQSSSSRPWKFSRGGNEDGVGSELSKKSEGSLGLFVKSPSRFDFFCHGSTNSQKWLKADCFSISRLSRLDACSPFVTVFTRIDMEGSWLIHTSGPFEVALWQNWICSSSDLSSGSERRQK